MSNRNLARRTGITVKFNNVDISDSITPDLIRLTYTDAAEGEPDDLKITVADSTGKWVRDWLKKELENRDAAHGEAASGGGTQYTVTARIGLNVREGRGTSYNRVGSLEYGKEITVYEIVDGWASITYGGKTCYVSASYLKKSDGTSGGSQTMDGSGTNNAKFTKISAAITMQNWDTDGKDRVLDCGTFELDEVNAEGPPQQVTMSATSLSYEAGIRKTEKTRAWSSTDLKAIAERIAWEGCYECLYSSGYNPKYGYVLQQNESDMAFLARLSANAGIALKVANGIVVLYDRKDFEGQDPITKIERGDGSYTKYRFRSRLSTTAYSSCHVSYEDDSGNTYEATFTPPTGYAEGDVLEVSEQVSSNEEAMILAQKRLRQENKGEMTGSFSMIGDTRLLAGMVVEIKGWGDFDGNWMIEKATHSVSRNGYTVDIEISKVIEGY